MDSQDIDAFIAHSRQVAAVQKQRWQGVDPTRLEQACDIIELLRRQLAGAQLAGGYAAPYASQEAAARALGWVAPASAAPPVVAGSQILWRARWDVTQQHQSLVRLALADLQLDLVPRPQGVVSSQLVNLVLLREP